jgi:hypothetical protein
MCLALQYALVGESRRCIYVDPYKFRSYRSRDGDRRHTVIAENIDSERKRDRVLISSASVPRKATVCARHTRRVKRYIAEVLDHQPVHTAFGERV